MQVDALKNQRVLVVGLGLTGMSVARFLVRNEIAFDVAAECDDAAGSAYRKQLDTLSAKHDVPCLHVSFTATLFCSYDFLVLSPGIARRHPAVVAALKNGVEVIGDIELFAGSVDVPVIAVTGSNGKSTVVSWLASALRHASINAVACGNIGEPALDSLLVQADVFVLELSSYQLESTYSLRAVSAVVLNVSEDHLDRYDDIEHYAQVKRRLLDMSEHVIANQDDPRTWPDNRDASNCEYFTIAASNSPNARWHRQVVGGLTYLCDAGRILMDESQLLVPGEHNVANALAVLALASPWGVTFEQLHAGLIAYQGLPHRSQYVGEYKGVRWYNDSKGTNIDACKKAVRAMPGPVILIAGGISKGADFTALNDTLECCVRLLILLGRDRQQMAMQMTGAGEITLVDSLIEAVELASRQAEAGDVVLLSPACSSFDMFSDFEDRGTQFIAAIHEVMAA